MMVDMKLLAILCLVSLSFSIYIPQSQLPGTIPAQAATPQIGNTTSLLPGFNLISQRSTGEYMYGLFSAKMTNASRYDMAAYRYVISSKPSYLKQRNYTFYLYSYDGTSINLISSTYPYNAGEDELHIYEGANPSTGTLALGGTYKPDSGHTQLYYGKSVYSGGALKSPATGIISFGQSVNERVMLAMASGNVVGSSAEETLLLFKEYTPMKVSKSVLYISNNTSKFTYDLPKLTSAAIVVGNFAPASGNEIAVVGNIEGGKSWLYLLKVEGNAISKLSSRSLDVDEGQEGGFYLAAASDLDSDGYDELVLAGTEKPSGTMYLVSTSFFHVYKYATSGWMLKNAYTFSSMVNNSSVSSIGVTDVDLDGKGEIVVANRYSFWAESPGCTTAVAVAAMFDYEPSKTSPTLLSSNTAGSAGHCTNMGGSQIEDFDGNGKKELALIYYDDDDKVLALYSLGYTASKNATNATANKTLPSGFTMPQAPIPNIGKSVEEAAPAIEVPAASEPAAPAQEPAITTPETPAPAQEPSVAPETPSTPSAGQAATPETLSLPSAPSNTPSTDAAKAGQAVAQLEESIATAKAAGANTSSAETYLAKAQQSLSDGSYSQASTNAARGETLVEAALARAGSAPSPAAPVGGQPNSSRSPAQAAQPSASPAAPAQQADYTPYYIGAAAAVILGVAYMFTHRPQPPRRKK